MADYNINIYDEEFTIELNEQGPQGATGPEGPQGIQGEKGEQGEPGKDGKDGEPGPANTLTIGTVEKGEEASATITGTSPNQVLSLVLPKGDKGDKGEMGERGLQGPQGVPGEKGAKGNTGERGPEGKAATIQIGEVYESDHPWVTNSGSKQDVVLDFGLQKGIQGDVGPRGISVTGVEEISKIGLVATYRMYFSNGEYFDYQVTDGDVEGLTREQIVSSLGFEPASYTAVEEINDLIPNEATTNNKLADKAWVDGEISSIDSRVDMVIDDLEDVTTQVNVNTQRIEDLTTARIPDVIYYGTPKIVGGQVSNFSTTNYLQFPFEDISRSLPFDIYFSFTTSDDVTTQQNILDSHFGIALAILNGKGIMALSSNGQSWDIGTSTGTNTLLPNTTYYVKYSWTGTQYSASLSTNDQTYIPDMELTSSLSPYKTTIYIGGCDQEKTGHTPHPFKGIINFTKSRVDVNGITVWEGMADVGIASRANVSLNNLDEVGEARFNAKQDTLISGTNIKTINGEDVLGNGNIEISSASSFADLQGQPEDNANLKNALDSKQDKLTAVAPVNINSNTTIIGRGTGSIIDGGIYQLNGKRAHQANEAAAFYIAKYDIKTPIVGDVNNFNSLFENDDVNYVDIPIDFSSVNNYVDIISFSSGVAGFAIGILDGNNFEVVHIGFDSAKRGVIRTVTGGAIKNSDTSIKYITTNDYYASNLSLSGKRTYNNLASVQINLTATQIRVNGVYTDQTGKFGYANISPKTKQCNVIRVFMNHESTSSILNFNIADTKVIIDGVEQPWRITDTPKIIKDTTIDVNSLVETVEAKQDKIDDELTTTDKTIVGAINEVNSTKQDKLNITLLEGAEL